MSTPEPPAALTAALPGARFDPVTGADLSGGDSRRRRSYALQQGEPVMSFNLVSSLLPLASGTSPQTYRWALALGLAVPVVAGALGFLAFAFVSAALVVPVVYTVYLYDVNQWDDQPLGVTLGALGAAGALGVGFTWLWHGLLYAGPTATATGVGLSAIDWKGLAVLCLLVPVVSEVLKQLGPVLLSRLPAFDDLIDALTFGVAAGAAYAAAETIVVNRALFGSFGHLTDVDSGFWVSLVLSAAIVKPVVYGAATGIALAAFSAVGRGYAGFTPAYVRGFLEAVAANVAFQLAMYLAGRVGGTTGAALGLVLGAIIAVVLILRLRSLLHVAVLEVALEEAAGGDHRDTARGAAWCPACDLPLLEGANFCVACGTAVRAASKVARRRNAAPEAAPADAAPHEEKQTALVVGAALAVVLLAGLGGQVAAAASGDAGSSKAPDISITPDLSDSGVEPAPSPAPAPGPSVDPADPSASPSAARLLGGDPAPSFLALARPGTATVASEGPGAALVPASWRLLDDTSTHVVASNASGRAMWMIDVTQPPAETSSMLGANLQSLVTGGVQGLTFSDPVTLPLPSAAFVSAQRITWRGLLAGQQGGSVAVEGFAFYLVRSDGVGLTATALYNEGEFDSDPQLAEDYTEMLSKLIQLG